VSGVTRNPNYRQVEAYEYGDLREIRLLVTLSEIDHSILWTSDYTVRGVHHHMGGFAGPFEALAYALQECKTGRV
jgi:hypothetical protein